MAIQRVPGMGLYLPHTFDESATSLTAGNIYRLDASGEVAGVIFRAPKAGTIIGCDLCLGAVANAPDSGLQIGRQGITAATGLPDGTFVASVTTSAGEPAAAGWVNPGDWDTPQVVARGELICLMVVFPSFVAGDSVTVGAGVKTGGIGLPYGILPAGTKSSTYIPIIFPRYSDGTYGVYDEHNWAVGAMTLQDHIRSNTTPDEIGLAFTSKVPLLVTGVALQTTINDATSDYDVVIYDAAGRIVSTQSIDASVLGGTGHLWHTATLPEDWIVRPNTEHIVAYKPTTTNASNMRPYYGTFPSAAAMNTAWGGTDWYAVVRTDGGAWTRYNNATDGYRRWRISLLVNGFDDGAVAPRTRPLRRPV